LLAQLVEAFSNPVGAADYKTPDDFAALLFAGNKLRLRLQIEDLISFHDPAWAAKIRHGRIEALAAMPSNVKQCFSESGLLEPWDRF
jgi:hypothetical protein